MTRWILSTWAIDMASVPLEKFLPFVVAECLGAPEPTAVDALRNACFDFCRRSLWWTERQDSEVYTAGVGEYQLMAPPGAVVVSVQSVNLDGERTIKATVAEDVDRAMPAGWTNTGPVQAFVQPRPDTIQFIPAPDKSGSFVCIAAFAPSRTTQTVPDGLFHYHLETIVQGALSKLKRMPGQAWTDPAAAVAYERLFLTGINAVLLDRNRGPMRAGLRIDPIPFV